MPRDDFPLSIPNELRALKEAILANSLVLATIGLTNLIVENITAATGKDLTILGVTGKDILLKLTDTAGARKVKILDSADAEVATIDSDGNITATKITSSLAGDLINNNVASKDYAGAHADWTLSATEKKALVLAVTNADGAANIIAPAENRMYIVTNGSGQTITIKKAAGTGVAVANGKAAIVYYNGTDYARATADATV